MFGAPAQLGGGPVVLGVVGSIGPVEELPNPVVSGSKVVPDDPGGVVVVEEELSDELPTRPLSDPLGPVVEPADSVAPSAGVVGGSEKQPPASRTPSNDIPDR